MQAKYAEQQAYKDADIIHHIGQATALIGFAAERAARFQRIPFVVEPTCHPFQAGDTPLDHRLFRRADRLLVYSHFEADHFRSMAYRVPIDVVGSGIKDRADGNAERFRQQTSITGKIILYVGRKDPDKGYPLVIEAFRDLRTKMSDVSLVCIGPPGSATAPASQTRIFDLGFVSEQTNMTRSLRMRACAYCPSGNLSVWFMEAGRYSKPVVARRLPVLDELLGKGGAGLLVGTPDRKRNAVDVTAEELAASLYQLLNCPKNAPDGSELSQSFR
jgi:glycosyltransferase involved in cell wall biosynthesis